MKFLVIDGSGEIAGVSIVTEQKVIAEITINNGLTHGETLAPLVKWLLETTKTDLESIDYVVTTSGPGSFTGLRIAGALAKSIAQGIDKNIIAVPTLEALAYNVVDFKGVVVPIIDAKSQKVFTAFFENSKKTVIQKTEVMLVSIDELFLKLDEEAYKNKEVLFIGDGVYIYKEKLLEKNTNFFVSNENNNFIRGSSICMYAINNLKNNMTYDKFYPTYFKLSQAEENIKNNANS